MNRELSLTIAIFIALISTSLVLAEVSVGVKKGDWIEYQVAFTGTPDTGHDITWARMEIINVQGKAINLNITTEFVNGTLLRETVTLNLETGQLGDDFIIPANLKDGDAFFDRNVGNITIGGAEQRTYAGAARTVIYASSFQTMYYWDKVTGVLVEATTQLPGYTITSKVDKTNMWQPSAAGTDSTLVYIGVFAIAAIVLVLVAIRRRKKGHPEAR